jgi:tRNA-2-methylthio-N6-dimethylallyladenosine synthase
MISEINNDPALDVRLDRTEHYEGLKPTRASGSNAWVTIMRGCDKFCTFCIVPYVRGRERSSSPDEILRQVAEAAATGFQEVTLLGQTVNSYRHGSTDFADLLAVVARVEGIRRIRFTSPHPSAFCEKLIETMAGEKKICRHIHLPVQSGSDDVLASMKRDYSVQGYLDLVGRLRGAMPGLCLSTDIIVGFPGESEADFSATLGLMRTVRFDSAFMFRYSRRKGTAAHREFAETVPEEEKIRRLQETIDLQNRISEEINLGMVGHRVEVLVEGDARKGKGRAMGKTNGFKTVVFDRGAVHDNTFVGVEVTCATSHTLTGVVQAEARTEV